MKTYKKLLAVVLISLFVVCTALFAVACGGPSHVHTLIKVAAKQATCKDEGNIEYWTCSGCDKLFTDENGEHEVTAADVKTTSTTHGHLTKTEGEAATCVAEGIIDYWTCDVCEKIFSDANATTQITLAQTVSAIAPTAHEHLTKTEAVAATCVATGNIAYWTCGDCGKLYSDENGTTEVTLAQTVEAINPTAHGTSTYHEASEPDCKTEGNLEHYTCDLCEKTFSDAACTTEVDPVLDVISTHGHLTKTDGKEATCAAPGNIDYWTCDVCGKLFSDEDGETQITQAQTVIAINPDAHGTSTYHEEEPADCSKTGTQAHYTCDLCGNKFSDASCEHPVTDKELVIPVTDVHGTIAEKTLVKTNAKPATCKETGNIEYYTCTICTKVFEDEACEHEAHVTMIDVLTTHEHLTPTAAVAATCTTKGNIAYWTCDLCERIYSDIDTTTEVTLEGTITEADPDAHVHLTKTDAVAATCAEVGNYAYWTCDACEKLYLDENAETEVTEAQTIEAINPTAHGTYTYHEGHDATCLEAGNVAYYSCDLCHNNYEEATYETKIDKVVIDILTTHTSLTHTEATAATCSATGIVEHWTCTVCNKMFTSDPGTPDTLITDKVEQINPNNHVNTTHNEADPADCSRNGTIEYWHCNDCNQNFSDEACRHAVTDLVDPQTDVHGTIAAGTLTKTDRVEAKCNAEGNIEYYTCEVCNKIFSDEACTNEVTETVIPTTDHHLEKTEEVPFQCTVDGTEAYWTCEDCGNLFSDAEGTSQIDAPVAIPAHHLPIYTAAKEPTWGFDGCKDHWQCTECLKYFNDEDGTDEATAEEIIIARAAKPVIEDVENPDFNEGIIENPHNNYRYINVYDSTMIRKDGNFSASNPPGGTVYNFWNTATGNNGWNTMDGVGTTATKYKGQNTKTPGLIADPDTDEQWVQFAGQVSRFRLFHWRDTYTSNNPNNAQPFSKSQTWAAHSSMNGFMFLYSFTISANGGYTLVLGDKNTKADLNQNQTTYGFIFSFEGNTVTYRFHSEICATATLVNEDNNFNFADGQKHDIAFAISRVDNTYLTIALYVDGYFVKFEKAQGSTSTVNTVTEDGTFLMDVSNENGNGEYGEYMAFIANYTSAEEYTTLRIYNLDIRYLEKEEEETPAMLAEEVATEAKYNYIAEAEEDNTDGND